MDATAHLVVAAALGRRMHPVLAFAVGIASHAVLDAIPHYNYTGWEPFSPVMVLDVALGACLAAAIALRAPRPWGVLAGAAGGAFPDVERVLSGHEYSFLRRPPLLLSHRDIGLPWGLVTQAAVTVLALVFGLWLPRRAASKTALARGEHVTRR